MNLLNLFSRNSTIKKQATKSEAPAHWIKCQSCQSLMYYKEIENQNYVCPKCGFHLRIGVKDRIALLADENSFVEFDDNLKPIDPLKFVDKKSYAKRIEEGKKKTGRTSSVVSGECRINNIPTQTTYYVNIQFDDNEEFNSHH